MIKIQNVSRRYGAITAVYPTSLEVARGETVAIVGPSGAGKTTLLRCVAGLDRRYQGIIELDGRPANSYLHTKRPAFVVQRYANFHWMTVTENLREGLSGS